MSLPKDWYNYKVHYNAYDRLQGSKRGARRREKQIARMQDDESRVNSGGCFGVLVVLVMSITMGLLSCGGSTPAASTEVVEQGAGREFVDGVVMAVEKVGDREYVLVMRVRGGVERVSFVEDNGWVPEVDSTLLLFRWPNGDWRFQ